MLSAWLLKYYINNNLIIGYPHFIPGCFYTCQGISYTRVLRMREGGRGKASGVCSSVMYVCKFCLIFPATPAGHGEEDL